MGYIQSGKDDGAKCIIGGDRHGTEGYFINPTIFTDVTADMKIVKEEIFGPVGVVIKFTSEEGSPIFWSSKSGYADHCLLEVIKEANDTTYGLAAAVFTQNLVRAIEMSRKIRAGTAWVRYHYCLRDRQ